MENPFLITDDLDEEQDGDISQRDIFEAQSQVSDDNENSKSEEIVGDTGAQVQNILEKFGDDINKALSMKRKHMETYVKDCIKGSNRKLKQIWKMNARERKKINSEFSKQYLTTFQQWDMDIQKADEEQEKFANNFQKQQKAFKLSKSDQSQSLQAIRQLHEKFMETLENLETNSYVQLTNVEGELKKEISAFQRNLTRHTLKYSSPCNTSD